jgi:hypothetical protein
MSQTTNSNETQTIDTFIATSSQTQTSTNLFDTKTVSIQTNPITDTVHTQTQPIMCGANTDTSDLPSTFISQIGKYHALCAIFNDFRANLNIDTKPQNSPPIERIQNKVCG